MQATDDRGRTARESAIDGLRAIAQFEEYVAAEIDEPGYYGEMAAVLRLSAAERRDVASGLCDPPPSPPVEALRLVT